MPILISLQEKVGSMNYLVNVIYEKDEYGYYVFYPQLKETLAASSRTVTNS